MAKRNPWACCLVNLLAFPGMGTIMAGRPVGYAQATIMVAGFVVFIGFLVWFFGGLLRTAMDAGGDLEGFKQRVLSNLWIAGIGLGLSLLAWLWALISSISILRETRPPPVLPRP